MLMRYKDGDANVRSVWLCSRNDAIGNVVVMIAAAGVGNRNRVARCWRRGANGRGVAPRRYKFYGMHGLNNDRTSNPTVFRQSRIYRCVKG